MKFPKLKSPTILSPMAGVTDVAFRTLCKKYGVGLTYTEFVHSTAITRGNLKSLKMLKVDKSERPVAVQLFGSSFDDVIEAAKSVEDQFDVIDINCGCPAWKVIKTGAGSEMLKNPEGIASLLGKLTTAINKPITIKIRSGIDEKHINAVEIAKVAEDAGAAAIAVHGRTQKQGYSGVADWEIIKKVKESVNIPVIGNGDVTSPEIFKKRLDESGVDAIMIARGAIGNPFLFKQINDYLSKGGYDVDSRIAHFDEYLTLAEKNDIDFEIIKRHALSFTKGMIGGAKFREKLAKIKEITELRAQLNKL
jgi:tRNA-dihydrouridine synthase B